MEESLEDKIKVALYEEVGLSHRKSKLSQCFGAIITTTLDAKTG